MSTEPDASTRTPDQEGNGASPPSEVDSAAAPPEKPAEPGVKKALMSSAAWTMSVVVIMQLIRFVSNYILTWLLLPDVFGLMMTVDAIIIGLHQFSDVGIGTSIVRHPRGDAKNFLDTAWTMQCIRGTVLFLASCLLAWPMAWFFDESHLTSLLWLLPAAGLTALINGFNSTALFLLERRLAQQRVMLLQLAIQVISLSIQIAWVVWISPTVWALIAGRLTSSMVEMAGSYFLMPGFRNRFHWDREVVHELMHFGKWVFLGTLCTFLADRSDRFVIPKLESFGVAGVYGLAVTLASVPKELLYAVIFKLMFPLYSRMNAAGKDMRVIFCRVHPMAMGFAAFLIAGFIAVGPPFVQFYRTEYHDAAWMLPILAVGVWLTLLEAAEDAILFPLGLPRVSAISNAAKALSLPLLVSLGFWLSGLEGLIIGFVSADFVRYFLTAWFTHRQRLPVFRFDLTLSLLLAVTAVAATWAGSRIWSSSTRLEYLWQFLINGALVVLQWGVVALVCWRRGMLRRNWQGDASNAPENRA